ncbi:MAG: recombinase family protein, partial [Deltaproteobacteria bacterium]
MNIIDMPVLQGLKLAVYARTSTVRGSESSIDSLTRDCRTLIEQANGTLASEFVFADRGVSGASSEHPARDLLMESVAAGKIDVIVTKADPWAKGDSVS